MAFIARKVIESFPKSLDEPSYCILSVDLEQNQLCRPNKWNNLKKCATGNDHASRELNQFLEVQRTKIFQIFRYLEIDGQKITSRIISDILQGREVSEQLKR